MEKLEYNPVHLPSLEGKKKNLESPESSSPIVTRAVAAGLQGGYSRTFNLSGWQQAALRVLSYFPQDLGRKVISSFQAFSGLDPAAIANLSIDQLISERLHDYQGVKGPFPCLTIGSALGGATAHLSLALNAPFLPQAFVLSLRGGTKTGDCQVYFNRSRSLVQQLVKNNPGIFAIQHFDPVHDEWLIRRVNHLRLKLLDLPPAYCDFIQRNLLPGGAVCYLDCRAHWLQYQTGERSAFQIGGLGDISPQEYLDGSERLERYCRWIGMPINRWQLPGFPLIQGRESEWGSEPGLAEAVKRFCDQNGYSFHLISLPAPEDFSKLAFRAIAYLLALDGRQPGGVQIEMFTQFDATTIRKSGLLPLWLVFNTWSDIVYLRSMCSEIPKDKPVFFSPLATFTVTPDLVPWSEWVDTLSDFDCQNVGTRASHYPADVRVLSDWPGALRHWCETHPNPIRARLTPEELLGLSAELSAGSQDLTKAI